MVLSVNSDYFIKQLIVVMVEYSVLFEVWTGFLNFIWTSFDFRGLRMIWQFCNLSYLRSFGPQTFFVGPGHCAQLIIRSWAEY
jgi:hypothetical protein